MLAEDIVHETRDRLAARIARDRLDNVSVHLGEPADPMLPRHAWHRVAQGKRETFTPCL